MSIILTNKFKYYNSQIFKERFSLDSESMYVVLAKHQPWPNTDTPTDNELIPVSTVQEEIKNWNEIIAAKRILPGDVGYVIKRHNWKTGTIYNKYSDDVSLEGYTDTDNSSNTDNPFYVVSNQKVYKCIDNANGTASTVDPSSGSDATQTSGVITTSDKYIWKYMYSISNADMNRWGTTLWIPVFDLTSDDSSNQWDVMKSAADGGVHRITGSVVADDGKAVTLTGDGSGFAGTVRKTGSGASEYAYVEVTNPGTGYKNVTAVNVAGNPVSGMRAILSPQGGHGWNARKELCGHYLMMLVYFQNDEAANGGIFYDNDFRKLAIVRLPISKTSTLGVPQNQDDISTTTNSIVEGEKYKTLVGDQRVGLKYSSFTGVADAATLASKGNDVAITQGDPITASGTIVHVDTTNNLIYILPDTGSDVFDNSTTLNCTIDSTASTVVLNSGVDKSDYDLLRYSGELIYLDYFLKDTASDTPNFPVRANNQTDKVDLVIEF